MHLNGIAWFFILYSIFGFLTVIIARAKFKRFWNTSDEKGEPTLLEYFAVFLMWFIVAGGIATDLVKNAFSRGNKKNDKIQGKDSTNKSDRRIHN